MMLNDVDCMIGAGYGWMVVVDWLNQLVHARDVRCARATWPAVCGPLGEKKGNMQQEVGTRAPGDDRG